MTTTERTLEVPGASLYYEIRGSGPVLILIALRGDSVGFASIAPLLASDYTVVTYDPRGISRSTIEDSSQDASPDLIADDVHRLLTVVLQNQRMCSEAAAARLRDLHLPLLVQARHAAWSRTNRRWSSCFPTASRCWRPLTRSTIRTAPRVLRHTSIRHAMDHETIRLLATDVIPSIGMAGSQRG